MISQRRANLVFAVILLAVSAVMAWIAWGFTTPPLGDATLPTKFFPLVLLGFVGFCVVVYAREYVVHGESGGDADELVFADGKQAMAGLLTIAAVCVSYMLWREYGFEVAGLFATPAIAFTMGTRQISQFAIIIAGAVFTYFVFTYGLGTQFV